MSFTSVTNALVNSAPQLLAQATGAGATKPGVVGRGTMVPGRPNDQFKSDDAAAVSMAQEIMNHPTSHEREWGAVIFKDTLTKKSVLSAPYGGPSSSPEIPLLTKEGIELASIRLEKSSKNDPVPVQSSNLSGQALLHSHPDIVAKGRGVILEGPSTGDAFSVAASSSYTPNGHYVFATGSGKLYNLKFSGNENEAAQAMAKTDGQKALWVAEQFKKGNFQARQVKDLLPNQNSTSERSDISAGMWVSSANMSKAEVEALSKVVKPKEIKSDNGPIKLFDLSGGSIR